MIAFVRNPINSNLYVLGCDRASVHITVNWLNVSKNVGWSMFCILGVVWKKRPLTHVLQGSNRRTELLEEEGVVILSTTKVNDFDDVHEGHNDVLWLDVQVEDASGMEVVQTLKDLHNIGYHVIL